MAADLLYNYRLCLRDLHPRLNKDKKKSPAVKCSKAPYEQRAARCQSNQIFDNHSYQIFDFMTLQISKEITSFSLYYLPSCFL